MDCLVCGSCVWWLMVSPKQDQAKTILGMDYSSWVWSLGFTTILESALDRPRLAYGS